MFKVYKPKGDRVKAVQVTLDTVIDLAKMTMGRLAEEAGTVFGFDYPTFEGAKHVSMDSWVVQTANNEIKIMDTKEFEETYEPAYNTATRT